MDNYHVGQSLTVREKSSRNPDPNLGWQGLFKLCREKHVTRFPCFALFSTKQKGFYAFFHDLTEGRDVACLPKNVSTLPGHWEPRPIVGIEIIIHACKRKLLIGNIVLLRTVSGTSSIGVSKISENTSHSETRNVRCPGLVPKSGGQRSSKSR